MSRYKGSGICDVCGDKTLCRNFSANACESCKGFFRRAIRLNKEFVCPSNSQCVVTKITRTMCKLCRLNKCLAAGMRRELIRSNEENKTKRKINKNKCLNENSYNEDNSVVSSPVSTASDVSTHLQQPIEGKDFLNELIDKTLTISDEELSQQISEIEINLPVNETNDEITEAILTSELRELSVMPVVRPIDNRNDWNCLETNRIAELLSATKIFDQTLSTNIIRVNTFKDMILNYNTKLEDFIVDIVRFTKSLNGFTRICSDDQWVLLKSGCIDMVLLREAMYYNDNSDSFFMRLDNANTMAVKLDVFQFENIPSYYPTYRLFMEKFVPYCKHDPLIADLLTAIVLFNSKRPNLKHKQCVKLEQQLYIYLLQRYLLLKYGSECESHSYLLNLLNMSTDLNALSEMQMIYAKDEEFKELIPYCGPLTTEIYELDTCA